MRGRSLLTPLYYCILPFAYLAYIISPPRFSGVFLNVNEDEIEDILEEAEDDIDSLIEICQKTLDNKEKIKQSWDS